MKQQPAFNQPDLFRVHRSDLLPSIPDQIALMSLVRGLLLEILSGKTASTSRNEGSDD
jgi:hypothetical protein